MSLDALNWKILQCLQENARQSNAEIGRKVGISSPAVSERIKKVGWNNLIEGEIVAMEDKCCPLIALDGGDMVELSHWKNVKLMRNMNQNMS